MPGDWEALQKFLELNRSVGDQMAGGLEETAKGQYQGVMSNADAMSGMARAGKPMNYSDLLAQQQQASDYGQRIGTPEGRRAEFQKHGQGGYLESLLGEQSLSGMPDFEADRQKLTGPNQSVEKVPEIQGYYTKKRARDAEIAKQEQARRGTQGEPPWVRLGMTQERYQYLAKRYPGMVAKDAHRHYRELYPDTDTSKWRY